MTNFPPPERALDLSNEFIECITSKKNVDEFQYFVEEIEKLHPDDKRKVFYNIAQKIKEVSDV